MITSIAVKIIPNKRKYRIKPRIVADRCVAIATAAIAEIRYNIQNNICVFGVHAGRFKRANAHPPLL